MSTKNNNNNNDTENNLFSKYLKKEDIEKSLKVDYNNIKLVSNDTINEKSLLEAIIKTGRIQEIFCAVLQMAIIGYGERQFNDYSYNEETRKLGDLFKKCDIVADSELGTKLDENKLTPRRLLRIFRYQIYSFLKANQNVASYLFTKYSSNDMNFREVCFPGAEHMVSKREHGEYLYKAYLELDDSLKHRKKQGNISDRIKRVLLARNVLGNKDFSRLNKEYKTEEEEKLE